MKPLRKRFIDHMVLKNFSPLTQKSYVRCVAGLAKFYNLSPDKLSNSQIQDYIIYLISKRKLSWSTVNVAYSAFRLFFQQVLQRGPATFSLPSRKTQSRLPEILSSQEVRNLINSLKNLKHRTILFTIYMAGLRASEVVHLQVKDIDSERMMIRIQQGKGNKDRYVPLSNQLLKILSEYWKLYRPSEWLFPTQGKNQPLSRQVPFMIFQKAQRNSGILKGQGAHTLRHCFATHLLEQGAGLYQLKELLGHASLRSTVRYTQLTQKNLGNIRPALEQMCSLEIQ